jgi:histidine triad (HIT) family protein
MNGAMNKAVDMDGTENCIFCAIARKETSAEIVHESDNTLFFHDISPKAAVHVVGIPKKHIISIDKVTEEEQKLMGLMMHEVAMVAEKLGLSDGGYRVITNVGSNAGQEVKHLHWHILGGEKLGPLRC